MNKTSLPVDPTNAEAAEAWNGYDGDHWVRWAELYDQSVRDYHRPFLDAARIQGTDRVLDIGCGNGQTTRDAAALAADGDAVGVDLSEQLVENARRIAAAQGVGNATFLHADAQVYPFDPARFNFAISRTGAMFFGDPVAAFSNIRRALRPGGRLALLVWQELARNEWISAFLGALTVGRPPQPPAADAPGPFSLAAPDRVHAVLGAAGFSGIELEDRQEWMWFGQHTEEAYQFVTSLGLVRWMLGQLDDEHRATARDALRHTIDQHATAGGVRYDSAAWIVTAVNSPAK
jgi:SAM-dependent methyltransferase